MNNKKSNKNGQAKTSPSKAAGSVPSCTVQVPEEEKNVHAIYEEKFKMFQASVQGQLDTLHRILDKKDDTIAKLNKEIGELKKGYSFLSAELSDLKKSQEEHETDTDKKFKETEKVIYETKNKTTDLEDRSRRSNLVFFNIPEETQDINENCEGKIGQMLDSLNMAMPDGEATFIDRAHRLGKRTPECLNKPRPIIVKFTFYKLKQFILRNGYKFKNSPVNMSEDFSRETLDVHKKLYTHGKHAANAFEDPMKAIK